MGHPTVSYTEQLGRRYKVAKDGHTELVVRSTMNADNGYTYADRLLPVNTSELDIFRLCALLGVEMSPEQAAAERAYIDKNRQQYEQKRHKTMEKKEFGLDANGYPVYAGETMFRKSNADKYTVQEDGSLKKGNGKTVTAPNWINFVHTYDKTDKAEQLAAARAKRFAPKQDNPLVEGESKIRTPEEASKAAAKQREQARKKGTPDASVVARAACLEHHDAGTCPVWDALDEIPVTKVLEQVSSEDLVGELNRRGDFFAVGIRVVSTDDLRAELTRRGAIDDLPMQPAPDDIVPWESIAHLGDKDLADELRRRGYEVKATKLVEL